MHTLEKQGEFFNRLENSLQDPAIQGSQVPQYLVSRWHTRPQRMWNQGNRYGVPGTTKK